MNRTDRIKEYATCNYVNLEKDNAEAMLLSCSNYELKVPTFKDRVTYDAKYDVPHNHNIEIMNENIKIMNERTNKINRMVSLNQRIPVQDPETIKTQEEDLIEGFSSDMGSQKNSLGVDYVPIGDCPVGHIKKNGSCQKVYMGAMPNYIYNKEKDILIDPEANLGSICKNNDTFKGLDENGYIICEKNNNNNTYSKKNNLYQEDTTIAPIITTLNT